MAKTDHLLLLVGINPLPNAIAAKLLAAPDGTITLIHSGGATGTADVAQRLRSWLDGQGVARHLKLKEVEESNPTSIIQGVRACLEAAGAQRVGLNYTGGTKAMSVHAYRTIEQWAKETNVTAVFSYLDARTLQTVFDPVNASDGQLREYVGRALELKLTDLLALHGWTLKSSGTDPILPQTAQALVEVHSQPASADKWHDWLQAELLWKAARRRQVLVDCVRSPDGRPCTAQGATRKWLGKGQLKQIRLQFPSDSRLAGVVSALQTELRENRSLSLGDAATSCGYREVEDFCKWLDGIWLESATLIALQNCATDCNLHDIHMNLKPVGINSPTDFEFDVVAIRGYQLFAFSCSTDTQKRLLQLKLFEAYIRARQLGGDEARVALVCCSDDPDGLEHEMRCDVDFEGRIRVFGRRHFNDLVTHIKDWIESQKGRDS